MKRTLGIGVAFLFLFACFPVPAQSVQTELPALKDVFAEDFSFGCLLSYRHIALPDDVPVPGASPRALNPEGGKLIAHHMNFMAPGNNMKPMYTLDIAASAEASQKARRGKKLEIAETQPVVRFPPDLIAQLDWAKRHGFGFRAHTLVWHSQTPTEFFRTGYTSDGTYVSRDIMTKRMEWYIKEIIRQLHEGWPGMVQAVDVVNEAIDDRSGKVRRSKNDWFIVYGDERYVSYAFEFARKYSTGYGESQMKLYYNDYNTHSAGKADGIVALLEPIYRAGNLDGIGMQEHDNILSPTAEAWVASYDKFDAICNEMAITEIDVSTSAKTNYPSALILEQQANQYASLFKLFLERSARSGRGKIVNVSKDGLNDEYTFVVNQSSSLWDTNFQAKPAYFALVDLTAAWKELNRLIDRAEEATRTETDVQRLKVLQEALFEAKKSRDGLYSAGNSAVAGLQGAVALLKAAL